ncbi:MAG TPA: Asp-tRNA(Asn)/Glu-tRNA(Gln) amidotransferase subunit GatC [Gemmatimonadaceae bacterium]|nr:Asp-tRNA(Asn)/Glu-tRNA(Gln) amidotransferase subunit GatC [Gemmatimonadaceae bacterium]
MAVTHDDVRNIAALARLAVAPERLDTIVSELNGILGHMEALSRIPAIDSAGDAESDGMRVAADRGPAVGLDRAPSSFAPAWRDGFFLVPRLATHGDAGAAAEEEHSA